MRAVICWPEVSGYMAACWRALAADPGIDLRILAFRSNQRTGGAAFQDEVVAGQPCRLLGPDERNSLDLVRTLVAEHKPEVIVVPGWALAPYRNLVHCPEFESARFVMAMDTPWRGTLRQRAARVVLGRYLSRMDRVVVAGERSWQYARRLGISEQRLARGAYGFDSGLVDGLWQRRRELPGGWPKRFLYVGRYVEPKAIDTLLAAYAQYRRAYPDPWPLSCCGQGELAECLSNQPGVEDLGFSQPKVLPEVFLRHGVFVMASRYEPWGVAIAEALGSGLPVICTEACGAAVELVRTCWNGITVPTDDVAALAAAMLWCHEHEQSLPQMGQRGPAIAAAYSAEAWALRWSRILQGQISPGSNHRA